jgi:hypothetical protein
LETKTVDSTRRTISSLLPKYRQADGDIVHIVHKTSPGAPVFTPDTELAKEFIELEPNAEDKVVENGFLVPSLVPISAPLSMTRERISSC